MRVGRGSATPNPTNRLAKIGTTHLSRAATISIARPTTATGINQRRLDGGAQLDRLFHIDGQALQNDVENTAGLTRLDHVGGEVVENDRIPAHGVGQRGPAFDRGSHPEQRFLEGGILLVGAENLQALHQGQARVNHDRELAEEHGNFLDLDLAAAERG